MSTARASKPHQPESDVLPDRTDRYFLLRNVSWKQYLAMRRLFDHEPGLRLTYLEGALELMSPSEDHELLKTMTGRLLEAYAEERDLDLNGFGSATYRRKAKSRGLEPDECYYLGPRRKVPDIAIEIALTTGIIDRLEVYVGLGVPEVWFLTRGRYRIYHLTAEGYIAGPRSRLLPDLDPEIMLRFVRREDQTAAVKEFRRLLRGSG